MKTARAWLLALLPVPCFACGSHSDEQGGEASAAAVVSDAARTSDPRGYLDGASCTTVFGWAQDTAVPTTSISADLYYDGAKGATGATRVRLAANQSRSDLCTALGSCDHAFSMSTPRSLMDGDAHAVYGYGINTTAGAPEPLLSNAPRTITCASPAIPSGDVKRALTSETILTDWHFDTFLEMAPYTTAELAAVPSGVALDSAPRLVQVPGQAPVYVVDGTYRRHVINETSMAAWRMTSANVTSITATALDALTPGPDWPALPLLAKSSSSATVYLLDVPLEATDAGAPDAGTSDAGSSIDCSGIDLQQGASGATVEALQHLLQADGYYLNEPVDGSFGSVTAAAVEGFQLRNGHLTVSGNIDSATCEALEHPAAAKLVYMYVNPNATPTYDLNAMKASGVTDVFFMDTGSFTDSDWKTLLSQCQSAGMRLSAWEFMNVSASYVGSLANLGLNIHMDLEDGSCNGSVSCVTSYVQSVRAACPGKLFTVATMPDGADSAMYYGQDYAQIAPSVDAICPMLYKGNYNLTDADLTSDAALMQKEAPGKIWITMQTYQSDSDVVALSASSLLTDVNAITASANGVGFFRYGLVNFGLVTE
jgi:hypothetical protein